jgi:hypothetical protein
MRRAIELIQTRSADLTEAAARRKISYNKLRRDIAHGSVAAFTVGRRETRVWLVDLEPAS